MPSFSNWRNDLREVVDSDTPEQNVKEIKDKKGIKNKVIINPTIPESLQEIGGELIDIREIAPLAAAGAVVGKAALGAGKSVGKAALGAGKSVGKAVSKVKVGGGVTQSLSGNTDVDESTSAAVALSPQELAIQKRKSQLDVRLAKKRQQSMNRIKKDAVDIEKQDELHQQQDKADAKLAQEETLTEVKVSRISPSDSKEDKKKKIQQMLDRQREWEKKKGRIPAGHATEEVVHEGKCEGCTCPGCSPDGVGHQNPCIECGGHHKEEKKVSEEVISEKDLSAKERRALPNKDFALPGKGEGPQGKQAGSYPIPDEKHARSALSLVSQHGTPEEKAKVRAKVKKKFPGIQVNEADDKAFKHVVGMLQKKYGKDSVITKDSPKPKPQPKAKPKPQKPLSSKEKAQREVDAQYGRTAWNKKGSLGT